ncbi:Hsp20 family protein [Microbulbifer harenosus]|uniref:Hsp20 family protein n=1 Tax=Microbulbifer harenosus TaxID=2576840 RepID=A0ABY2UKE4_9GAMM|nr:MULTISPECIES: Hsp20 family protein [Microbulbifer]QIL89429.1 Hsp20 family protein [Microbulbifer sp. SH-1]TLM78728.1 Hsp20 family protein [Microbulbifer harenosus]
MRNLDLSPLYRSAIGFDRLASLLDSMSATEQNQPAYPPYNIELTGENSYRISMAVAGFEQSELDVQMEQNRLTVSGKKAAEEAGRNFLHRGIAARSFERRFQIADHVRVTGAQLANGLLHVDLVREIPEAMKPRKIEISSGNLLQSEKATQVDVAASPARSDAPSGQAA